jgi:hypothetical protein
VRYDGHKLRTFDEDTLVELLFRFVRMSQKSNQQETIYVIKDILRKIGPMGLT